MALRPSQVEMLRAVAIAGHMTRRGIEVRFDLDREEAHVQVEELRRDGYICRVGRSQRFVYRLTQLGKEALESSEVER